MSSVNISITEDVYKYLTSLKGNSKSYSQVIRDLKEKAESQKGTLNELKAVYGLKKDLQVNEAQMKSLRESVGKRL